MHLRTILFAVILACTFSAHAQKSGVEIGPEIKIEKGVQFWKHLHSDASGHYVVLRADDVSLMGYGNRKQIFQKYDRKFELVFSREFKAENKDIDLDNMLYAKDKFLICTHTNDKGEKKYTCSVRPVDFNGKAGKVQKVVSITYKDKDDRPSEVSWQMSEDTTQLLCATIADDNDDDLKARVSVSVYDNQLNKVWAKNLSLPYSQEQVEAQNWRLANDGQVYLLAKVYDGSRKKESKKIGDKRRPAYRLILFRFNGTDEKAKETVLSLDNSFVTDVTFKLNHINDIICAGFYAEDTKGVVLGVFYIRIDGKTGAVMTTSKKEFLKEELAQLDTKKDRSGDQGLDSDYKFNELILRDDGGVLVTAESVYKTVYMENNGVTMRQVTIYHKDELFVTSVGPDGNIDWVKVIPKRQEGSEKMFIGYMTMYSDNVLYLLYNDDVDNIKQPLTAKAKGLSSFRDAAAALVTISPDGRASRRKIFDAKEDADALMVPENGAQISPDELFFVTTKFKFLGKTRLRLGVFRL